ncbi:MAG: hypothetical protein B9S33_12385 [Pedosphaera sp. Tous-C6FEB]|nr:MAG: hypothetical protein B9S33_12385 [Pedosphaera sp. Tous-C6FEB]
MNEWIFFQGDTSLAPPNIPAVVLGLLLSFLLGQTLAWTYMLTHAGLSYSRSFVNALVVTPVIVSLVMTVLSNNIVTAFGMMAVFAIVRFRNILRDTLDTTFVLTSIFIGMGCGTQKFSTTVVGALIVFALMVYLWFTNFGARHRYDLILNLHWARSPGELMELSNMLSRHSRRVHLASQRSHQGYEGVDFSFRLLLRDPARADELVAEVQALEGASQVTTLKAEDESEL